MSLHSYSRCWLHLTCATLRREPILPKPVGLKVSSFLYDYARSKKIYMRSNYVNPDHTHALIDLPTNLSIEKVMQLLRERPHIGSTPTRCCAERFRGDAATGRSRFRTRIWMRWCATSRIKRNIIAGNHLLKRSQPLLKRTGWNGMTTRAMARTRQIRLTPNFSWVRAGRERISLAGHLTRSAPH